MKLEDLKNSIDNIKPDPYMETRLAQKVFEAAPKKRSKRKLAVAAVSGFLSLALVVTALGFGGFWQNITPHDPEIDNTEYVPDDSNKTEYLPTGGDINMEYERAYNWKIYTLSDMYNYIAENRDVNIDEWLETKWAELSESEYGVSDPNYVPWTIEAIEVFEISKEEFEKINADKIALYESTGDDPMEYGCYTQEEIDAIYSNNPTALTETFATDYAIVSNSKAYAPAFYLNATQKELKQYGISTLEVDNKIEILLEDAIVEVKEVQ